MAHRKRIAEQANLRTAQSTPGLYTRQQANKARMQLLADAASVLLLLLQGKTYQDALNATDLTIDIAPQRLIQSADALTGGYGIVSHFQFVCM